MKVKIKRLDKEAIIPEYQTPGASGFDFHAARKVVLKPGETKLIPTGFAFEVPEGYELQIRPRSCMSYKSKLRIANSPGTIDSDYLEEVFIIMENTNEFSPFDDGIFTIDVGQRIAQGVICPIQQVEFEETEELSTTERAGGFGSTGE